VDDRAAFVAEAFDAIAPGGSLIVVNWHDRPREATTVGGEPRGPPTELRMPPEETEGAVSRAAAFELDRRIDLPPYHYALVFRR
ncbi:SAM-dependent methyltransferase, partial [Halorubrum sp. C3]